MANTSSTVILQGYGTRKHIVDVVARTAHEEKIMRRTGKRYLAKVSNPIRLRRLLVRADAAKFEGLA